MIDSVGTNVARDMEKVFAGMPRLVHPAMEAPRVDRPRASRTRIGVRTAAWLALAAVLVAAIVSLLTWPAAPPGPPVASRQAVPARPLPQVRSVVPQPSPIKRPVPPVVAQVRPVAPVAAEGRPVRPVATPAEKPGRRKVEVAAVPAARPSPRKARPAVDGTRPAVPTAAPSCQGTHDAAGCFYRAVLDADRALRRVYIRATNAGVAVSDLHAVRRSWKTALSRSRKDPTGSITTLEGLTADLLARSDSQPRANRREGGGAK